MSDDEHHETFEQAGAGASLTYPMQWCVSAPIDNSDSASVTNV